jgi:hypothetical protein
MPGTVVLMGWAEVGALGVRTSSVTGRTPPVSVPPIAALPFSPVCRYDAGVQRYGESPDDEQIQRWLGRLRDGWPTEQVQARHLLANVFEQRGMYEEAIDLLVANVRAGERNADIFRRLARLHRARGDEDLAMQAAAEAVKYMPPAPVRPTVEAKPSAAPVQFVVPKRSPQQPGLARGLGRRRGVLISIAVVTVGLLIAIGSLILKLPPSERDFEFRARQVCQQYVMDRLRAPATFPAASDQPVFKGGDGGYLVRLYVDSQNGFGALIRITYRCTVRPVTGRLDGTWDLISMEMTP